MEGKVMRQMNTGRGLGTAALEVRDRQHLEVLTRSAARQEAECFRRLLLGKQLSQFVDLCERVDAMVVLKAARRRPAPFR
ncbi:hypothetical protein D3C87_1872190 [compost metagenome]